MILLIHLLQLSSYSTGAGNPEHEHQDRPRFPGALNSYYTEKLEFDDPDDGGVIPVYRVMDRNGKVFDEAHDPKVSLNLSLYSNIYLACCKIDLLQIS